MMLLCNMNLKKSGKERVRAMNDSACNCSKGCELISKLRVKGQNTKCGKIGLSHV